MINDEFSSRLNLFTLRFTDPTTEEEYHAAATSLMGIKVKLMKIVLLLYSIVMVTIFAYFTVELCLYGPAREYRILLVTTLSNVLIVILEVLFNFFNEGIKIKGILATIAPFISYQIFLSGVNPSIDYPPGDFAAVAIMAISGRTLCYNWLIAAGCYIFVYVFFFLYAFAVDTGRYGTLR